MKKLLLFALPIFLFACKNSHKGNGRITTETRATAPFTAVDVSSSIGVELEQGDKNEVVVEADDNIIKYLETTCVDGKLTIRMKSNTSVRNATLRVRLISPLYKSITGASSSEIVSRNTLTSTDKINIKASSSADITLQIDAPAVIVDGSSSADINITGRAKQVDANASSSTSIDLTGLKAETVAANATSSGLLKVFASVKLDASASSSGDIKYTGGVKDILKKENSSGEVSPE